MQVRRWLALAVIAVWLDQAFYLWPLPPEAAAQSAVASDPNAAEILAWWESRLWVGWVMRIVAIPVGVLSGVLALRDHRQWPIVLFVVSIASFFAFRVWQWIFMFMPLFTSAENAIGRATWLLQRPQFIINGLVFPAVLVVAATYSGLVMKRKRTEARASE